MSLLEQQNLLARLYLDEDLRRAFLSDPAALAGPFGLSDAEIAEIALVVPEEISSFADSLFRKRAREIEKMLPLTRQVLGAGFDRRLTDFKRESSGRAGDRLDEAIEFCDFLKRNETRSSVLYDAAKLEQARLLFNSGRKDLLVRHLCHDFRGLPGLFSAESVPRKSTYWLWLRAGRRTVHRVF
jgi:hypothetical protein